MPIERTHEPLQLDAAQRDDITRRAMMAWFKTGKTEIPSAASGVKVQEEMAYAVLHGAAGVLAVYRVRPDNLALRAMKRWPASIEG